jgi:hypothetical protein
MLRCSLGDKDMRRCAPPTPSGSLFPRLPPGRSRARLSRCGGNIVYIATTLRTWSDHNASHNMEDHASPRRPARLSLRCDTPKRTRTHGWGANRVYGRWAGHKLDCGGDLQGPLNQGRDRRLYRQGRRDRSRDSTGPKLIGGRRELLILRIRERGG